MQKTLGGKIWSLVQLGCTLYVGQRLLVAAQKKIHLMAAQRAEAERVEKAMDDKVDIASEDSFPASDPPSYGGSQSVGPIH